MFKIWESAIVYQDLRLKSHVFLSSAEKLTLKMPTVGIINPVMYIWIIGSFLKSNWITEDISRSPSFFVDHFKFNLGLIETKDNKFQIHLERSGDISENLKIHSLKLDLIGFRTFKNIFFDRDLQFLPNEKAILTAQFMKQEIVNCPNCLFFQDLHIRVELKRVLEVEEPGRALFQDLREEMRNPRYFDDFVLECDNQEIPVLRKLLAARSEVFAALFSANFEEGKMGRARVKDVDFKDLEALVKFCQTDELEEKDATVGLFAAAHKYMIKCLADKCEIYLLSRMTVENAVDYFLAAYLFNANLLKKLSSETIIFNFHEKFEKTEGMKNLLQQYPEAAMEIMRKGFKIPFAS